MLIGFNIYYGQMSFIQLFKKTALIMFLISVSKYLWSAWYEQGIYKEYKET